MSPPGSAPAGTPGRPGIRWTWLSSPAKPSRQVTRELLRHRFLSRPPPPGVPPGLGTRRRAVVPHGRLAVRGDPVTAVAWVLAALTIAALTAIALADARAWRRVSGQWHAGRLASPPTADPE